MKIRAGEGRFRAGGGNFRAARCSPLLFLFMGNTSIRVCRPQRLHSNYQVQGFYFEKSSSYLALLSWTSCLDPLLLLLLLLNIIFITVAPRVGDMSIDALKVVFGGMLDSRVAPGKQLKKDIKVDRRTTVSLFLKMDKLIMSERL